jgi:hypothetical protein
VRPCAPIVGYGCARSEENIATVLSRQLEEFPSPRDAESCFWPCDENYNKTRWPTDANGVML